MENSKEIAVSTDFNGAKLSLSTGKLANQADASVVARLGDTTVLATVVSKPALEDTDFFPLKIDYEERFYAGGTIGGSRFVRREGKPSDEAVVSGRLIDHAIRPLFSKDFMDDTQIIVTVLSLDNEHDPVALGLYAVSAALMASGLPFSGPIVSLNIDKADGVLTCGLQTHKDDIDMHLAVSYLDRGKKIQAIEAEAKEIPEEEVLSIIKSSADVSLPLFDLISEFCSRLDVKPRVYKPYWMTKEVLAEFTDKVLPEVERWKNEGLFYTDKAWSDNQKDLIEKLAKEYEGSYTSSQLEILIGEIQKVWVRKLVVEKGERIDGRALDELRTLSAEIAVLPRVHGTGLFARGGTQALSIVTLGPSSNKLISNKMDGEEEKRYFHHYNFPPFSTGEIGKVGGTNRRAIGHGMLAEKALKAVLPSEDAFPYTIRVVSEIMGSNGSTSMASTCGSSLALMDAGVPISNHVGGIGIGLFVDKSKDSWALDDYVLLTDILGYEDFSGYMDFKMTGTRKGMTAIQLELKLQGLPVDLFDRIFSCSREARLKVLDLMESVIDKPRANISEYAPKIDFVKIKKDDIGKVIGSGGSTIKRIMEESGAQVDVEDRQEYGLVSISSVSAECIAKAKKYIVDMLAEVEEGAIYEGPITRIADFGAFVEILPTQEGLLHVSEWSYSYVDDISKVARIGDVVRVKVLKVENGKFSLSKKALEEKPEGYEERPRSNNNDSGRRFNNGGNNRFKPRRREHRY